jgi:hypothetical protein
MDQKQNTHTEYFIKEIRPKSRRLFQNEILFFLLLGAVFLSCNKESSNSQVESVTDGYIDLSFDGVAKSRVKLANIGGTGFGPSCTKGLFEQHVYDNDNSEYSISISFLHEYYDKNFKELVGVSTQMPFIDTGGVIKQSSSYCGYTSSPMVSLIISYKDKKTNSTLELQTGWTSSNVHKISNVTKISTNGTKNNYSSTGTFKSVFDNFSNNKTLKLDGNYKIFINTSN